MHANKNTEGLRQATRIAAQTVASDVQVSAEQMPNYLLPLEALENISDFCEKLQMLTPARPENQKNRHQDFFKIDFECVYLNAEISKN